MKHNKRVQGCVFDEPFHYHHDGCPSCSTATKEQWLKAYCRKQSSK